MKDYIEQISSPKIVKETIEQVYLKWINTEDGRDKFQKYERISSMDNVYYVNIFNRKAVILPGTSFFDILEEIYYDCIKTKDIVTINKK